MKPEEIDRKIAERVMGHVEETPYGMAIYDKDPYKGGEFIKFLKQFNPSTNISHAFEVVEKFEKDGWLWTMSNWMVDPNNIVINGYLFDLWKKEDEKCQRGIGSAETRPMAISLAILEAIKDQEAVCHICGINRGKDAVHEPYCSAVG